MSFELLRELGFEKVSGSIFEDWPSKWGRVIRDGHGGRPISPEIRLYKAAVQIIKFCVPRSQWLKAVRRLTRACRYVSDVTGFQKRDYWQTLREFLEHGWGDCEDWCPVWYLALRELGLSPLLLLVETKDGLHAVVVVHDPDGSDIMILGQRSLKPQKWDRLAPFYKLKIAFDDIYWYRHKARRG